MAGEQHRVNTQTTCTILSRTTDTASPFTARGPGVTYGRSCCSRRRDRGAL